MSEKSSFFETDTGTAKPEQWKKSPSVCRLNLHVEANTKYNYCCWCSDYKKIFCQVGDGKTIHNYCNLCYRKRTHFCKGENDELEVLCAECQMYFRGIKQ